MENGPSGRVALAPTDRRSRLLLSLVALVPALFLAEFAFRMAAIFAEGLPNGLRLAVGAVFAIAAFASVIVFHAVSHPTPIADFDSGRLIVGVRSVAFVDILEARLVPAPGQRAALVGRAPDVVLRFGRGRSSTSAAVLATVPVETAGASQAGDLRRAALLVVLDASGIRMPDDPHDPTGRFSHYNFPDNLEKQAAIDLIENAGRDTDPPDPPVAVE